MAFSTVDGTAERSVNSVINLTIHIIICKKDIPIPCNSPPPSDKPKLKFTCFKGKRLSRYSLLTQERSSLDLEAYIFLFIQFSGTFILLRRKGGNPSLRAMSFADGFYPKIFPPNFWMAKFLARRRVVYLLWLIMTAQTNCESLLVVNSGPAASWRPCA